MNLSGAANVVLSVALAYFAYVSYQLDKQNSALLARAVSFDAGLEDGDLTLELRGDQYVQPDLVEIQPVFLTMEFQVVNGDPVLLPIRSGEISSDNTSLQFRDVEGRVCQYGVNFERCQESGTTIQNYRVRILVNGVEDIDDLRAS